MKLIDKAAVAEMKDLYEDIDKCIGDLVLARSKHDQCGISDAHWKMETLMVNTQQVFSYILQHLEEKEVDLKKERIEECPFRKVGCEMYEGHILECKGACSWVVDHLKLKELKAQKGEQYE